MDRNLKYKTSRINKPPNTKINKPKEFFYKLRTRILLRRYKNSHRIRHQKVKTGYPFEKLKYKYPLLENNYMKVIPEESTEYQSVPVYDYNLTKRTNLYFQNKGLLKHKKVGCSYSYYDEDEEAFLTSKPILTPFYQNYDIDENLVGEALISKQNFERTLEKFSKRMIDTEGNFNKILMNRCISGKSFTPGFVGIERVNKLVRMNERYEINYGVYEEEEYYDDMILD